MPAFNDIPYTADDIPSAAEMFVAQGATPAQLPYLDHAYRTFMADTVRACDTIAILGSMEMQLEEGVIPDFTELEIETFRVGALAGINILLEKLKNIGALDDSKFGAHVIGILKSEMDKGWRP